MTCEDLTADQAKALHASVTRYLRFLGRLRERMEKRGFPPADPLYRLLCTAWVATHALAIDLHYRSCDAGAVARQ